MVEQEIDSTVVFLPHAHFNHVRHFEQRMDSTELAEPDNEIVVKELMAHGADVDRTPLPVLMHRHSRPAGVEILGIGAEDLAAFRFDDVAPETSGMKMGGGERPFQSE